MMMMMMNDDDFMSFDDPRGSLTEGGISMKVTNKFYKDNIYSQRDPESVRPKSKTAMFFTTCSQALGQTLIACW